MVKKVSSSVRRVTVDQVARRAGVSATTVSLVLNGKAEKHRIPAATQSRVLAVVKQLRYRPSVAARQLAGKRSDVIGVLVNTGAMADPRLILPMEILAAQRNLRFILGHAVGSSEDVWRYLEDFRTRGVDGIISFFHSHPDYAATVLPELARFENVVYFERPVGLERFSDAVPCYVQPDYEAVGRLGTQHLLESGRRRIAMVMNDLAFPYATARRAAYQSMLEECGIGYRENLVWVMDRQPGMHWWQPFDAARALMAIDAVVVEGEADAILAVNDMVAARLIVALRQRGRRVPDDVAIVGCDNLEVSTVTEPMITTLDLRSQVLAESTMQMLFRLLDDQPLPEADRSVTVAPVLVVRNSTE